MEQGSLNKSLVQADFADAAYSEYLERLAVSGGALVSGLSNMETGQTLIHGSNGASVPGGEDAVRGLAKALFSASEVEGGDREVVAALLAEIGAVQSCAISRHTILFQETETVLVQRMSQTGLGVLISVSNTLPIGSGLALVNKAAADVSVDEPKAELGAMPDVLAGAGFDLEGGAFRAIYRREDEASRVRLEAGVAGAASQLLQGKIGGDGISISGQVGEGLGRITRCLLITDAYQVCVSRVPMALDHVLYAVAPANADPEKLLRAMDEAQNDVLRKIIEQILSSGLQTKIVPFPRTEAEFLRIVEELRELDEDDLIGRLDIGGFVDHGFGEGEDHQRCQECIYYLPRKKWCDIPELPVPVEAHWWCRLWKM